MPEQHTIYTIGYGGKVDPRALHQFAVAHDALLADVRMSARARVPQWNQGPLQRVFGERYVHIKALGNANYKGALGLDAGIVLNQPERGVEWATTALRSQSIILLCACKDYHECHRTTAAELLHAALGNPIVHLSAADLPLVADDPLPPPSGGGTPAEPFKSYLNQERLL